MNTRTSLKTVTSKINGITLASSFCFALAASPAFAGSIERISVDSGNIQINSTAQFFQTLSDDGRYVAFNASLAGEPSYRISTFLRDRATGITEVVSIGSDGSSNTGSGGGGSIGVSNNGRYVAFISKGLDGSIGYADAYVRDRATGTTELISVNNDGSLGTVNKSAKDVSISGDGRYIAFVSTSEDLVVDDNNGLADVFVRDRINGTTQRISIASDGSQANGNSGGGYRGTDISADGRYVVFNSSASNLVANDSNGKTDLFIHDLVNGSTTRINLANSGSQSSIGHDGWFDLSSDGRYVAFSSFDSNLVANDSNGQIDIFVRDLILGTTERASTANDGSQANSINTYPGISSDGRYVSFISMASNLVTGGTPQMIGAFVHDRVSLTTEMVDTPHNGSAANGISFGSTVVSGDGRYILFPSSASNLVAGDSDINNNWDVFLHDRISGQVCQ